jgi:uncharacterized repeat protein (TIGR03803 family)
MRSALLIIAASLSLSFCSSLAWAGREAVMYSFAGNTDGANPTSNLIRSGPDVYGTTSWGGTYGWGTVFKLTPGITGWTETVLYNFTGGVDGAYATGSIAMDSNGNIYGATGDGGSNYKGNVFKLSPNADGTWTETVLYNFTGQLDGAYPFGGVTLGSAGNLYGTAYEGGLMSACAGVGCGVVFQLTGTSETVLHAFSESDGALPSAPLIMDAAGAIYGTASAGGSSTSCIGSPANGCGVVFQLRNDLGRWTETVLHSFGTEAGDGISPTSGLSLFKGDLYGTTFSGGSYFYGTVFKLGRTLGTRLRILYSFAGSRNGYEPNAGVVLDNAGNIYGTTRQGGREACYSGCGTVFELTHAGTVWNKTVLHRFTNIDGANPYAPLYLQNTTLYGTTAGGGTAGTGVVFEIEVSPQP